MDNLINSMQNKALEGLSALAPRNVVGAIKDAAEQTGVDFAYLLQQAKAESGFDADAKAKTSSATGLFQFIESTWMDMVDKYGDKHGIDPAASKSEILSLRSDPEIASKMAAEFAGENKATLDRKWGGETGSTEMYFAHFMGASGASSFLSARDENPLAQAAVLFPQAAAANENIFYDRATGRAKSLDEVYAFFDKKFTIDASDAPAEITQLAEATTTATTAASAITAAVPASAQATLDQISPLDMVARGDNKIASMTAKSTSATIPPAYQSMLANPLDLMLLTQLDLPGIDSQSKTDKWLGQSTS